MSRINSIPANINYLGDLSFLFFIEKLPNVNFFLQSASIPSVFSQYILSPNPFVDLPVHGDHMTFDPLEVTFIVDEDMRNYFEIYKWIRGYAFPTDFKEHKDLAEAGENAVGKGIISDATLLIGNNMKNMNIEVTYVDAFPFSLSGLRFNTTDNDMKYLTATVQFKYTYYDFQYLNSMVQNET